MQTLHVVKSAVLSKLPERGRDIMIVIGGLAILCGLFDITAVLANSGYSLWIFALSTLILLGLAFWCNYLMKNHNTFFGRGSWALIVLAVAGVMAFITVPMIPVVGVYIPEDTSTGAKGATQQMFGFVFLLDLLCVAIILLWCYLNYKTGWTLQFVKQNSPQRLENEIEAATQLTVDLEAP